MILGVWIERRWVHRHIWLCKTRRCVADAVWLFSDTCGATSICLSSYSGSGKSERQVNSVAFSSDNRQIVSGSRDKTIRLWNTLAECKYTITEDAHSD